MSFYRIIDHTADLGIIVEGPNRRELFKRAALALTDLLTDIRQLSPGYTETVTIKGHDLQDLLINWLREILYLWNGRNLFATDIHIHEMSGTTLSARIAFTAYNPERHTVKREIKAVTYHQAEVVKANHQWIARVICDV